MLGALTGRWLGDGINIQIQASLGVAELKRFPQLPARFQHVFLDAEHGMELEGRDGAGCLHVYNFAARNSASRRTSGNFGELRGWLYG